MAGKKRLLAGMMAISVVIVCCTETKRSNAVSFERGVLVPTLADPAQASTFAQTRRPDGHVATLLVTSIGDQRIEAVDLTQLGAPLDADIFTAIEQAGDEAIRRAAADPVRPAEYAIDALLSAAGVGRRHLATGTNFREHAKEAEIGEVFNFPKFGPATPARTVVGLKPGALLDYEVEICARFDRNIRTIEDFDAARKGFFLCGDFTDRATLMRLVDPQHVGSGQGFSDAKSARDFFPTGALLVVPRDWRRFVATERMTTAVNSEMRQDARGGEMILDFREIVRKALTGGGGGRYVFRGVAVPLLGEAGLARGAAVMSGTSEGVIFMPPRLRDYLSGGGRYVFTGPMISGGSAFRTMVETFIAKERRSGRYLNIGDNVVHRSSSMGDIRVEVVPGTGRRAAFRPPAEETVLASL